MPFNSEKWPRVLAFFVQNILEVKFLFFLLFTKNRYTACIIWFQALCCPLRFYFVIISYYSFYMQFFFIFISFCLDAVKKQILQYQSGSIGLFPLYTNNVQNEESHVRDNIYCAMGVWALALAYRFVTVIHKKYISVSTCFRRPWSYHMLQKGK